jgi:hypothetical protein
MGGGTGWGPVIHSARKAPTLTYCWPVLSCKALGTALMAAKKASSPQMGSGGGGLGVVGDIGPGSSGKGLDVRARA